MSLFKIASVAAIALTLGACQSLFQPNYLTPLPSTNDASEQLKPGCTTPDCPLVNIDTLHFPTEPALDGIVEKRLLQMTRTSPDAPVAPTLAAYREQFLRDAAPRYGSYLQAKVREQHDGLVIIELASYLDTGEEHGKPGRGFINYSRQQHKVLSVADMLLPGQEEMLWKAARVTHNNWLIATRLDQEQEYIKTWPFQKTPNVALTSAGVLLKYDVSTIAPYALGNIELTIPYTRLNGILKPELFPGRH
ncbi:MULTISPECIES: RsiV family protein [unclassified Pseudomonas]|uniref:RsiV family protein n=1 Tax=unclassified Pseudomonas TaxID=196821 RepID=UPI002AC8AADA|nr:MULTISPECIES: RsiV family protein [unclassified Pseudomonas]MEB0044881.1 RsiV family protein [Pseudomonas sp. Dout3]MEB0096152.1 RsiV family protein [Pseudomonas sp. DC1.2]WPX59445.1 RsiV family protein [Pseudomonas sp. DC1.2]